MASFREGREAARRPQRHEPLDRTSEPCKCRASLQRVEAAPGGQPYPERCSVLRPDGRIITVDRDHGSEEIPNDALVKGHIGEPATAARIVETALSRFQSIDVSLHAYDFRGDTS